MPREAMIPPMDLTAEELADRLLALPPKPRTKKTEPSRTASSRRESVPMAAKSR